MLNEVLQKYLELFPQDKPKLKLLEDQLKAGEDLVSRNNFTGHITGSPIIFSPDYEKLLLIFHPTIKKWMQPGGHWDEGEEAPWLTAEREGIEETGVCLERMLALPDKRIPIQIFQAYVPNRPDKNEPEHYHHDWRYAFLAASEELKIEDEVIKEARWTAIKDLEDPALHEFVERTRKLVGLKA